MKGRGAVAELPRLNLYWLTPIAQESQQHQEQVDEIKIEGEGAEDGRLRPALPVAAIALIF